MPRRCKTCSHKNVKAIDNAIASSEPYLTIASRYGLSRQTVQNHAKNHVKPLIAKANAKAEALIVNKILEFRKEVNYPPLEKTKYAQEQLLNKLTALEDTSEFVAVMREWRGWFDIENKLAGKYLDKQENPANLSPEQDANAYYKGLLQIGATPEHALKVTRENRLATFEVPLESFGKIRN